MTTRFFSAILILMIFGGCSGGQSNTGTDSLNQHGTDSMPVLKPKITDTNSTIITPPVNDSNVVVPDSNGVR